MARSSNLAELWERHPDAEPPNIVAEGARVAAAAVMPDREPIEETPSTPDVPQYADILDDPARNKVLFGGRGAGRSWSVARKLLERASRKPTRILCTRELQASIKDSVHRLLQDQIEKLRLGGFTVTDREIRHRCGSLFIFKGIRHNIDEIKSMEGIDICWVEEAERVSSESWKILTPTIRKDGSEIWVNFNPDQPTDPTYTRFGIVWDKQKREHVITNPPPSTLIRFATWQDNPWFPETLRSEMEWDRVVDPDAAAWVWDGECRSATDAQVLRGKWTIDDFEPGKDWDGPYQGADWGFAEDPTVLSRLWIFNRSLYIERESYAKHLDSHRILDRWGDDVPDYGKYLTRADNARPETISYLQQNGYTGIVAADKWPGSVEDGIAFLRQFEKIIIHSRCKNAANEARLYSYKVDRLTGDIKPDVLDAHNHCVDSWRYALAKLIRASKQKQVRVYHPGMQASA